MSPARRAWWVSADRRAVELDAVRDEARQIAAGIEGMVAAPLDFDEREANEGFRDFVPVIALEHDSEDALEYAAELILEAFGWRVDLRPAPEEL